MKRTHWFVKLLAVAIGLAVLVAIVESANHPTPAPVAPSHVITDICEPGAVAIQQACTESGSTSPQCAQLEMSARLHERANGTLSCPKKK